MSARLPTLLVITGILTAGCDAPRIADPTRHADSPANASASLTALSSDSFDRPDESPIGGNWVSGPSAFPDLALVSGAVSGTTFDQIGVAYYGAVTWPADQWSEARITGLGSSGAGGVAVRLSSNSQTGYILGVGGGGTWFAVVRYLNGAYSELQRTSLTFATGDALRLEVQGSTLRAYRNGTLIATVSDGAIASGNAGLGIYHNDSGFRVDDWSGGNLSGDSVPPPPPPPPPPDTATDRLPDLGMARLSDFSMQSTNGRHLLRYSQTIVNVGNGAFELHGQRATGADELMSVTHRIFNNQGGFRDLATAAVMVYTGDGHDHWHVRDLQLSELRRQDNGQFVTKSEKRGFCFWDNVAHRTSMPGAPQSPVYDEEGCGHPESLTTAMGLSIGWGDIYPANLPNQYIDVTGVPDGRYRLIATADPSNWFAELNESNNSTWADIEIYKHGTRVRVLSYGPSAIVADR